MRIKRVEHIMGQRRFRITAEFVTIPGLLRRIFLGEKYPLTERREYVGDCTVWYELPDFRRCGTFMEARLAEALRKAQYEGMVGKG